MKNVTATAMLAGSLLLSACATTEKVAVNQLGDEQLSCQQIVAQDKKVDEVIASGDHNKGASGANVAAVLLFWPAAVGNYMDADKAQQLAEKRKSILADLYKTNHCGNVKS
jgi:type IV pilus biogenesis protein CpaD/CtpE